MTNDPIVLQFSSSVGSTTVNFTPSHLGELSREKLVQGAKQLLDGVPVGKYLLLETHCGLLNCIKWATAIISTVDFVQYVPEKIFQGEEQLRR